MSSQCSVMHCSTRVFVHNYSNDLMSFFAFSDLSTTSLLSRSVPSNSYASAASPPIQDGSSSPMSSTSGASSLGSSWTPRGQQPSPPSGLHNSRATATPTASSSSQAVANLTEAEALLQLSHCQESDEGIVSDQSSVADPEDPTAKRSKVRPDFLFLRIYKSMTTSDLQSKCDSKASLGILGQH